MTDRLSRRRLVGSTAAAAAMLPFATRAQEASPEASPLASGEWSFTDDRGITVTLPQAPTRIVADLSAAAPLWDFGIRPLAVSGWTITTDAAWGNVDRSTPVINAADDAPDPDLEQLVALDPDLFVSISWAPDQPENVWSFIDADSYNRTNDLVPVVCISATGIAGDNMLRFAELAGLLGADLEDTAIIAAKTAYEASVAAFGIAVSTNPEITSLFGYIGAADAVWYAAYPPDWADLAWYVSLGMNVVVPEAAAGEFWQELSLEQAVLYPSDIFFHSTRDGTMTAEEMAASATFGTHPAVAAGQLGAWNQDFIMSYQGLTAALDNMIGVLSSAEKVS